MTDQNDAQRWMGAFALEGDSDQDMAAAELNYHPRDGIFVRTLTWTGSEQRLPRQVRRRYPALKGVIEGTRRCTVLHAFETSLDGSRYEQSHIVGNAILLDGFCDDPVAPAFRQMQFRSPAFTAIANPRGVNVDFVRSRRRAKIVAEPRKAIEASWGQHKLAISSLMNVPGKQAFDGTFLIAERPYLEVHFAYAVSFDEILRITAALEFFACVGDGAFSGPPEVSLWSDPAPPKPKRGRPPNMPRKAGELLLSQSWYKRTEAKHSFRRTILLDGLALNPLTVVSRWLDLSKKVERPMTLFHAASETPNVETRFLFLVQALEGLHRTLDNRPGIDQGEFERGVAAMITALPTDLSLEARRFLKDRAPHHNELGLSGRLKDYGDRVTNVIPQALPGFSKDRRGIIDLRNEFSHALPTDLKINLEKYGQRLIYYSEILRLLFEFNLLYYLDLDPIRLRNAFAYTRAFENLARARKQLLVEDAAEK
ncbi:HEPN domain-containing protein [Mesorhizobium sp. ISC11]|uniref:HEPN domain-containing protein n=1 Tax=Mesorhizobium sp. ISC11 TaxID=3076428 RepID=UPI00301DF691